VPSVSRGVLRKGPGVEGLRGAVAPLVDEIRSAVERAAV
jgi:hypothetical protein